MPTRRLAEDEGEAADAARHGERAAAGGEETVEAAARRAARANRHGIRARRKLHASKVQHAARVKIDEEGCEAAAFTAIIGDATSAMPEDLPVVEMELDRPFAFAITGADGLPLFVGAVNTME